MPPLGCLRWSATSPSPVLYPDSRACLKREIHAPSSTRLTAGTDCFRFGARTSRRLVSVEPGVERKRNPWDTDP
jgi:hypothetical protein